MSFSHLEIKSPEEAKQLWDDFYEKYADFDKPFAARESKGDAKSISPDCINWFLLNPIRNTLLSFTIIGLPVAYAADQCSNNKKDTLKNYNRLGLLAAPLQERDLEAGVVIAETKTFKN